MERFQQWLNDIPFHEPSERKQAVLFQTLMLIGVVLVLFSTITDFLEEVSRITLVLTFTGDILIALAGIASVFVVRRGYLQGGALVGSLVALIGVTLYLIPGGITHSGGYTLALMPVIALVGLLAQRRALLGVLLLMISMVLVITALETFVPRLVGFEPRDTSQPTILTTVIVSLILNALFLDRFALRLRDVLRLAEAQRQRAETALGRAESQAHALEQKNVRLEQTEQMLRDLVDTLETPSIAIAPGVLLAPLVGLIDSARARRIATRLLHEASAQRAAIVVLDIAGVAQVDTAAARALVETAAALRLLGCRVVMTGIAPAVATTLTALGVALDGVDIARSPQDVLEAIPFTQARRVDHEAHEGTRRKAS